jgi:GGDEF domain-containing protein
MICRKIEGVNDHLRIEEGDLPAVSVSAGAAYCSGRYPGDVFEEADAALYRVKRSGGSRCEVVA